MFVVEHQQMGVKINYYVYVCVWFIWSLVFFLDPEVRSQKATLVVIVVVVVVVVGVFPGPKIPKAFLICSGAHKTSHTHSR